MHLERVCKHCCGKFLAKKDKQWHCSRRCFKQHYYALKRLALLNSFPFYKCPKCERVTKLGFDPSKKIEHWVNFRCPWCYRKEASIELIINETAVFVVF